MTNRAAVRAGLNLRRFERDWRRGVGAERVDEDIVDAQAMHLSQPHVFFIDNVRYEGSIDAATRRSGGS